MEANVINFIVGYLMATNIIGIALIWLKIKTKALEKVPDSVLTLIHIIISMLGGFIGTLVGAEMMNYRTDTKIFKRWIPLILIIEFAIIIYILYQKFA